MNRLQPSDSVTVSVLVDNISDILSRLPEDVASEVKGILSRGTPEMSGDCLCCAAWGLSLLVTVERDGARSTVLFDSGPESYAIDRNGTRLGIDFGVIDSIVLSHGHWDHAGGMLRVLERIAAARLDDDAVGADPRPTLRGDERVPFHVNPGMFAKRAGLRPGNVMLPMQPIPSVAELEAHGADVVNDPDARLLHDGRFYLSGEIPRVTAYERGLPSQYAWSDGDWRPDPLLLDERFMAVSVKGKGAVVFSACSHAGIVNVLRHAREVLAPEPIYAVMGGFHLSGTDFEPIIADTVADLREFDLKRIVPGHCTGWRATYALVDTFGDEVVVPSAVGRVHQFHGA